MKYRDLKAERDAAIARAIEAERMSMKSEFERLEREFAEERARLLAYQVVLEEDGASFGVYFPRDEDLNNEIKTVPCRSFSYTPRFRWLIPTNLVSAQCLHAFLVRHPEFQLTREVALRLQQAADATTPVPAPVPTRREQRSLRRGGL